MRARSMPVFSFAYSKTTHASALGRFSADAYATSAASPMPSSSALARVYAATTSAGVIRPSSIADRPATSCRRLASTRSNRPISDVPNASPTSRQSDRKRSRRASMRSRCRGSSRRNIRRRRRGRRSRTCRARSASRAAGPMSPPSASGTGRAETGAGRRRPARVRVARSAALQEEDLLLDARGLQQPGVDRHPQRRVEGGWPRTCARRSMVRPARSSPGRRRRRRPRRCPSHPAPGRTATNVGSPDELRGIFREPISRCVVHLTGYAPRLFPTGFRRNHSR